MTRKLPDMAKYVKEQYEAQHGPLAHFVQTLDGLGMEDFPERDYFIKGAELLREARALFKSIAVVSATGGLLSDALQQDIRLGKALVSRIEHFLEGKE